MSHTDELKAIIQKLHGVTATHVGSKPVKEVFQGETVWDTAYAWLHDTGDPAKPFKHVTVLHIPPVVSPVTAVRAFIRQESGNATA